MASTSVIRDLFCKKFKNNQFIKDKTGYQLVEIVGQSFIADEPHIIREPNEDYIQRELEWYEKQSLYVREIPGATPMIWEQVSSNHGRINSNYGWCIYSETNYKQYERCLNTLLKDKDSRRAIMIYNRPSMQHEYKLDGMSDFMCTNAVSYMIRDNKLHAFVQMRSNDAVFGYNNDWAWQNHVLTKLVEDYNLYSTGINDPVEKGFIYWNASSIHVYERHFHYIEELLS